MQSFLAFLNGKKTYVTLAFGLIYLWGSRQGWWPYDQAVAGTFGVGALAFLRAGVTKAEQAATAPSTIQLTSPTTGAVTSGISTPQVSSSSSSSSSHL